MLHLFISHYSIIPAFQYSILSLFHIHSLVEKRIVRILQSLPEALQKGGGHCTIDDTVVHGQPLSHGPSNDDLPIPDHRSLLHLPQGEDPALGRVENGGEKRDIELGKAR